ncbi:MAG: hypothetical protein ACM34K_15215, partial [Bacillota bacterium]
SYNRLEQVKIWIVGDNKTPVIVGDIAQELTSNGLETIYLDVEKQKEWGKKYLSFYDRIPYNNETRRNIGYLCALEDGCDLLISIDDDNFPTEEDFIGLHAVTGSSYSSGLISEVSGFHNICEYLQFTPDKLVFPRGFPFKLRGQKNNPEVIKAKSEVKIGLNTGLWLLEPDIDATTWLNGKVESINYSGDKTYVLDQNTWTPINTQNTSVIRDLIPAYFCIPMGWDVPGGKIQRYGDIWGGYFFQALIKNTSYHVAFGRPIVAHKRNPHDYVDDLRFEFWGMILTDWLTNYLMEEFNPEGESMITRLEQLSDFLKSRTDKLPKWCPDEMKGFMNWTADNIYFWAKACGKIIEC